MKLCASYIAGFFDGEGSVSIAKHGGGRVGFFRILNVSQKGVKGYKLLKAIQSIYGGYLKKPTKKRPEVHCLVLYGKTGERFLKAILPYLQIKNQQAKLFLDFPLAKSGRNNPLNPPIRVQQNKFRQKIQVLNHSW